MDITSVVIGGVGGLVAGLVIGLVMAKSKAAAWEEQLSSTRDKLEQLKAQSTRSLEAERAKLKDASQKLATAVEESKSLKKKADKQAKENEAVKGQAQQIQASLQKVDTARGKAEEMAEAHRQARQQAEGRCKQAEGLTAEVKQEAQQLRTHLDAATSEKTALQQTVDRQAKEVQRLRADLSAAGAAGSGLDQSMEAFAETDGSLEGVLNVLLENEGQAAVVLADTNGIVVSAVGEHGLKEGLAASAQLVDSIIKQFEGMVPFGALRSYYIQDDEANVIAGRAFKCAGETVGLVTYGPRVPDQRILDGARANLSAILE